MQGLPAALRRGFTPIIIVAAFLLLTGCAPRSYVVLVSGPDGSVGEVVVSGSGGNQVLTEAGQAANTDGSKRTQPVGGRQIERDFGAAIAARPASPVKFLLYFTTGMTLDAESLRLIPEILEEVHARPVADVSIIGHTDTVATDEYNDRLSLIRARRVAELLSQRGLTAHTLSIQSHGKRNLLIPTPDNTFEPRNRRVEISIR